jgi:hypothetical protein
MAPGLSPGGRREIMSRATEPDSREDAMNVGLQMVFSSYGWSDVSDAQVWDEELRLARLAADLGFDVLWSVEHHFNDYSFCPDNLQLMAYLAARRARRSSSSQTCASDTSLQP